MGMYDTVHFACPNCKTVIPVQTKAGNCSLRDYAAYKVPTTIAVDMVGNNVECEKCKGKYIINSSVPDHVSMQLEPYIELPSDSHPVLEKYRQL